MDTSTFSQARYDAFRSGKTTGLGAVTSEEVAKYLFDELDELKKERLMPYLTTGPETGISFYGGRRTMPFSKLSLRGYKVCAVQVIPLRVPEDVLRQDPNQEYWGALLLGYEPTTLEAAWLWSQFWVDTHRIPQSGHRAAHTEKLTLASLVELINGDDGYTYKGLRDGGYGSLHDYMRVLSDKIDVLQKATVNLSGRLTLGSAAYGRLNMR